MKRVVFFFAMAGFVLAQPISPTPSPVPTATPSPSPSPTLSTREVIDQLSEDELRGALEAIGAQFLDPESTNQRAMQRAALEGIIRRLGPGASLADPLPEKAKFPFLAEILDGKIGYIRPGAINKDEVVQVDAALAQFRQQGVASLVVDLRAVPAGGDYESAAEMARRFCSKGKLLFSIQKPAAKQERIFTSNQDPSFRGVIVVLTDSDTSGAAEVIAAVLRHQHGALVVGSDTAGAALEFVDVPVGGKTLRVAVARVTLPDGSAIYPDGVKPDIAIGMPATTQDEIFRLTKERGVSQFVFDVEKPRMNEAALVANTNPDIDSVQNAQRDRGKSAPLRDTVLQRAVDLVTAIDFYNRKRPTN